MANPKHIIQSTKPIKNDGGKIKNTRPVFYGEVISIEDNTDGGRIKVRIKDFDKNVSDENLPWSYPLIPKFFHNYPKKGEIVRILLEDLRYPNRTRYWIGSIISQPHKIGFDGALTALSTTNLARISPEEAPHTYPDADGIYPDKEDIAILGRVNTDLVLKPNQVLLRAGKHEDNNPLKLNTENPSQVILSFEENSNTGDIVSSSIVMGDKIALITHSGNPKFKTTRLTNKDKERIFENGHPIPRGDVLVEALNLMRNIILNHVHGYPRLPAVKEAMVLELEKIDFNTILQKNIVVN